ncbi:DUF89 domain-containing protein [Chloroflexota bacterium]
MKAIDVCYGCLDRLVRQAARLATDDASLRARAIAEGLKLLEAEFSPNKTTIYVATLLHRTVREVIGNPDPYRRSKDKEADIARQIFGNLAPADDLALKECLLLAVRGNAIDFFRDLDTIREDLKTPAELSHDDTYLLERKLVVAKSILYLADNAGEVFFDLPLIKKLGEYAPVTLAVKPSPVQNDLTAEDKSRFGLDGALPPLITTGTDTPGVDMSLASAEFKSAFARANLVLAKGMGHWEGLSELPPEGKVFYLLKAKCQPVADSLGVPLDSNLALLR